ncbi:hypothetical protein ACB092_05G296000 [Castanea dentata]
MAFFPIQFSVLSFGKISSIQTDPKSDPKIHNKYKEIISTIPRRNGGWVVDLYQYEGFWCSAHDLRGILSVQDQFTPQPNDVILSSASKSGAIMTRFHFNESTSPLLTRLSHDCVPYLEFKLSSNSQKLDLDVPLVATHIPYTSLPKPVMNSSCKIVYLCRDLKDVFVSLWHFSNKLSPKGMEASPTKEIHLRDAFALFCEGLSIFGPYWDHVLESPERILYLKYEDLKNETIYWVKEIAEFIGYPSSLKEEEKCVVQKIINLCSFEKLSSLEVNTSGIIQVGAIVSKAKTNAFFRSGNVGDWKNHLTPTMAIRLDQIIEQKLSGSGLTLHVSSKG